MDNQKVTKTLFNSIHESKKVIQDLAETINPTKLICVNCKYWLVEKERTDSEAKKKRYLETTRSRHPRKFNLYPTRDEIRHNGRNWGAECTQLPEILGVWINTQFFNDDNKEPEKKPTYEPLQNKIITGWSFGCNKFERYNDEQ